MEMIVDFLMDADEILGFDYSCILLFGLIACVPIAIVVALRLKRGSRPNSQNDVRSWPGNRQ